MKLAIVTTHPIQYYAPVFKLLNQRGVMQLKIFYTWEQAQQTTYDPGFGKEIAWDVPLLDGYDYTFVHNTARKPGSSHFMGIVNPTLIQDINDWQPDAILVFGWSYQSHLRVLRYFKGKVPILFRGDSHLLNEQLGIKQILRRQLLRWVYRHVDYAFYVGTNNKAYFLVHGLKEEQLIWAPHAVDNARFGQHAFNNRLEALIWRRSLGIYDDDFVFLFVGKLEPEKNPHLLLDAFILSNLPKTRLVIVGNGLLEPSLREKASQYPNIHFLPFQNQSKMPLVYQLGDVYVLSSKSETWGLAVNEAMACGLPIMASDKVGCSVDLVNNGVNGYTFLSENRSDLEAKMKAVIADSERLNLMGKQSYRMIQQWSFEALCTGIEKGMLSQKIV